MISLQDSVICQFNIHIKNVDLETFLDSLMKVEFSFLRFLACMSPCPYFTWSARPADFVYRFALRVNTGVKRKAESEISETVVKARYSLVR